MEYSLSHKVSADEEEELMDKRSYYIFPCHFLEEAVRAFCKCLGIETKSQEDKDTDKINPEKITPPTSEKLLDGAVPSLLMTYGDPPSSSATETCRRSCCNYKDKGERSRKTWTKHRERWEN
ncbi:uncharacterized protein LOC125470173 [Pyrus x bretschneideri]|uniref:uncharacterized protein LOC125470173 n=1 Tax=Pyrus x bretschneideri TaxID=225117 RepID=UPI00202F7187|nr:uncharacterized protein LOC125470173 [Pyrus x bretschneideri]